MRSFTRLPIFFVLFATGLLLGAPLAFAYVASSTNYRVQLDSVNVGGGLGTSTSYRAEDTLGESGVGTSSSASYQIKAGYQQMQESFIAVTSPGDVTLSPSIVSIGGGAANGQGTWIIASDNAAGYTVTISASASPAFASGANTFTNYVPAGVDPDFTFTTPGATSRFGFTPEGAEIVQKYKDNGAVCNAGALDTASACWAPLSTSADTIASRASANYASGTPLTVRFRAESGAANVQPVGVYNATATITVLPL